LTYIKRRVVFHTNNYFGDKRMTTRRHFLAQATGAALLPWSTPTLAADQLSLAKILLGAPAGGAGDLMARRLADKLSGGYASKVIVENKPGAGGQLAITALKDAPDDGSTLLLTPSSLLSIYPYTYARLPYKPQEDLAPVSLAAYSNHALGVGPVVPLSVKTLKDFLAWAKANPDSWPGPRPTPNSRATARPPRVRSRTSSWWCWPS
jgi:tripartite-type tricarboxylate transporter receptor subunit TctC